MLRYPHVSNFDMTLSNFIPVGLGERRGFRVAHGPAGNLNIQFNPATGPLVNTEQAGTPSGTVPNRILAFTLRFEY